MLKCVEVITREPEALGTLLLVTQQNFAIQYNSAIAIKNCILPAFCEVISNLAHQCLQHSPLPHLQLLSSAVDINMNREN